MTELSFLQLLLVYKAVSPSCRAWVNLTRVVLVEVFMSTSWSWTQPLLVSVCVQTGPGQNLLVKVFWNLWFQTPQINQMPSLGRLRTQATSYHYHQLLYYIFLWHLIPRLHKTLQILLFFCFPVNILVVPFNSEIFHFLSPLSGIHSNFWHVLSQFCSRRQRPLAMAFPFPSRHRSPLLSYSAPISQHFPHFHFFHQCRLQVEQTKVNR